MKTLSRIAGLLKDRATLVEVANRCDKAYAEGTSNADWYSPYGAEKPEKVAQNLAGLQAVVAAIGVVATLRGANAPEEVDEQAVTVLEAMAKNTLVDVERSVVLRLANATWGAGQSFRTDKGPLGRATNMNVFDLLDPTEVAKDLHQIQAAAHFLLEKLAS